MNYKNTYCYAVKTLGEPHLSYHDKAYGFPVNNDNALFARLILEINQAGLSWNTILVKMKNFYTAYNHFNIDEVANYGEQDIIRLLSDKGIIRNRLKINAAIYNANRIKEIQQEAESFGKWIEKHCSNTLPEWIKLFKKQFKFTGGEITKEFLMSTGYIEGAHHPECPQYQDVLNHSPVWTKTN